MLGLEGLTPEVFALLLLAALAAGWVDAVVGGGGLVQLPALLLVPGISPVQALATNKLAGFAGTTTSAVTYARRVRVDLRTAVPMALAAGLAAAGGAALAHWVPAGALRPVVLVALVAVAAWTLLRPPPAEAAALRFDGRRHAAAAAALGGLVGLYDGALGPGTGSFLVAGLVGLGYAFLPASAVAKVVNAATNLGALVVFTLAGSVVWGLGLSMAVANVLGGYLGARTAVARGSGFVRVVFLVVVGALVLRLGWQVLAPLLG
ncbi:TSUP family transporter [Quadrisphaera oryzae]|uniref:TSUP family transporter n=1 Tax=Quadrisphaera TaxID=317661 RepID=UPI001648335E|nr:TSUP family transporter [Quadrisphaera sp. RL12-1S]